MATSLAREAVVVDAKALVRGDDLECRTVLGAFCRATNRIPPSWREIGAALGNVPTLLALDGFPPNADTWAWQAAEESGLPLLLAARDGPIELDAVGIDDASRFLQQRTSLAKITWAARPLAEAVRFADGHPESLQRIGAACVEAAHATGVKKIGQDEVLEAIVAVSSNLPKALSQRLVNLAGARLLLLQAMVKAPKATPTAWAVRCDLEPKAAIVHLRRLCVEDKLVTRVSRGRYRITSPLVALHLQAATPAPVQRIPRRGGAPPQ